MLSPQKTTVMRMPANWLEWLGVIGSVLTIISFGLYLLEHHRRTKRDSLMLGFLHGVKSHVESEAKRPTTTGDDWQPLLQQVNDMLGRLEHSHTSRTPVMVVLVCILWLVTLGFYFASREMSGNQSILFGVLTAVFFIVASVSSIGAFGFWMEGQDKN